MVDLFLDNQNPKAFMLMKIPRVSKFKYID